MSAALHWVGDITTSSQIIEAWRRVASDPESKTADPVSIEGTRFIGDDKTIRILISRESADEFFGNGLFAGCDVLMMSASCWEIATRKRIVPDHPAMMAYIDKLLSCEHALASFDYSEISGSPLTIYRMIVIDKNQKPVELSPLQSASTRTRLAG